MQIKSRSLLHHSFLLYSLSFRNIRDSPDVNSLYLSGLVMTHSCEEAAEQLLQSDSTMTACGKDK